VRRTGSFRFLPLLILGALSIGCLCDLNFVFLDSPPGGKTGAASSTAAATPTLSSAETRMGEPRLVATFPSGAQVFLYSPQDDEVLTTDSVDVTGKAPPETVVTLNDEIAVAGSDGMFYARVPLEEGLNEVQCVASDLEGNEVAFSFMVVCESGGE
jgi:hypothetical protein